MIYGLIAAASWGMSTIAAVHAARQLGTYVAVLASQALGVMTFGALAAFLHPAITSAGAAILAGLAGAGLLGLAGWLAYYRALQHGPMGLISAIGASYGAVTALLAVLVLGERIGMTGGIGLAAAVTGVVLAAARPARARLGHRPPARHRAPVRGKEQESRSEPGA